MKHETFRYDRLEKVAWKAQESNLFLPVTRDVTTLFEPLQLGNHRANNRIAFQPMEGLDGEEDGSISELTRRRYHRFAKAGPGLIWFEAVATVHEARAGIRQLMLTEHNLDAMKRLVDEMREISLKENGYAPILIMQATNSGRYSRPRGFQEPLIAYNCPLLEDIPLEADCIVSDDMLQRYEEAFGWTARLCQEAGFDGMDVKCCHRYLASELLSAYTRPGSYGGCYENRTRFLKNAYRCAQASVHGDFFLTSRLNAYDGFPHPYGFGVDKEGLEPDLTEPIRLIDELRDEFNIPIINITMGNPYKNPHVNRPFDHGGYVPEEHPFESLSRMMHGVSEIQHALPDLPVIGSAFSYLRQFAPNHAAGMVAGKHCAMAGFGRMAFACPEFVQELRRDGCIGAKNVCVTCGGCTSLMRNGRPSGCVVRDRAVYKI